MAQEAKQRKERAATEVVKEKEEFKHQSLCDRYKGKRGAFVMAEGRDRYSVHDECVLVTSVF
jgi:hypothetical protein